MPTQSGLGEALTLVIVGKGFTVTVEVAPIGDVHPLLSVTVTLYIPAPPIAMLGRVVF